MKHFITFLILIVSSVVYGQADSSNVSDSVKCQMWLSSSDYTAVTSVKEIDKWVFLKFPDWENMSDPGKRFNATDHGRGPRKRLFFAARSGTNWIISYEHGGRGYHSHCFFIMVNYKNEIFVAQSPMEFKTMSALKTYASEKDVPFEKWNENEY